MAEELRVFEYDIAEYLWPAIASLLKRRKSGISIEELCNWCNENLHSSIKTIHLLWAIDDLIEQDMAYIVSDPYTEDHVVGEKSLNVRFVASMYDGNSVAGRYLRLGDPWLQKALDRLFDLEKLGDIGHVSRNLSDHLIDHDPQNNDSTIPTGSGRLVTLDHNSKSLKELEISIDEVIEKLRQKNDRSEFDPEVEMAAAKLYAGRRMLENPQVSVDLIERFLINALMTLAKRFGEQAVGMAAGAALTLTAQFFRISIPG